MQTVVDALIKRAQKLPNELYRSLTRDRGNEMADHKRFTLAIDIKVYFCDPQSPWQRGSNENTNGLSRQYLPKGIDLSTYSQAELNAIARRLNDRPRKTLNYEQGNGEGQGHPTRWLLRAMPLPTDRSGRRGKLSARVRSRALIEQGGRVPVSVG